MSGRIFRLPIPGSLIYIDEQLVRSESSASPVDRAIAENLRIDDRVSEDRADGFFERCEDSSVDVQLALDDHKQNAGDEFLDETPNGNNLVYGPRQLEQPELRLQTRFVTIQFLFQQLRDELNVWLRNDEDDDIGSATDNVDQWLGKFDGKPATKELKTGIASAHKQLLRRQLQEEMSGRGTYSDRVVWVGIEDEFAPHIDAGPWRWLEVLGLGHLIDYAMSSRRDHTDEWLILLSYRMSWTAAAARPTVLDAGLDEWHYPTPGKLPARVGGRTMVLGDSQRVGVEPIVEFIHNERRIEERDVRGVYRLPQEYAASLDLERTRDNHRSWMAGWTGGSWP